MLGMEALQQRRQLPPAQVQAWELLLQVALTCGCSTLTLSHSLSAPWLLGCSAWQDSALRP